MAAVLGLLGTVLAIVFPLLPVVENTATITWPNTATGTESVNAPLVAFRPESMSVSIPCPAVRDLDARAPGRATVLSTTPPRSEDGPQVGMGLFVEGGQVSLTNRGQQVATQPVGPGGCAVSVSSDAGSTAVDLGGGPALTIGGDQRPQVVGVYSDLDAARDATAGASVRVTTDTRYDTTPTALKVAAGVLALVCGAGALWALHALDVHTGRRGLRLAPRRWWRPTGRDVVVAAVLLGWMVVGGQTSDDGYTLGIARARDSAGYIGNYYRWFNVSEAPFGWFYELYSLWAQVSDSVLWLRLPSVLMGLLAWLLISRQMLPRLGRQVRRSRAASWAAATVFLCFWMAYDSGLRPEPVVVVCSLLALCAVERAVATRRLLPVAFGLLAAALAIGANPAGVIAVAPFLAAARPLTSMVGRRARADGALASLAPLAAAGTVIIVVAFADQSWAAVVEATRVRTQIGPNYFWFQELTTRYAPLLSGSADGSVARRFPVLLIMLCTAACLLVLVRHQRIRGAALGPSRRLVAITVLSFLIMALTPTKWTHHFGNLAALGAGLVALTALATGADVLRSVRNRALFLGGVLGVLALSFTGPNTWWYTNNWGVPWFDKLPSYNGWQASTILLGLAVLALAVAGVEHLRGIREERLTDDLAHLTATLDRIPPLRHWRERRIYLSAATRRASGRALRLASAPLALLCGALVVFELAAMVKAVDKQAGSYSMAAQSLSTTPGSNCGLADRVFAETNALDGLLRPMPTPTGITADLPTLLPTIAPTPPTGAPTPDQPGTVPAFSPAAELVDPRPVEQGFRRDRLPPTGGGTGVSGFEYTLTNGLGTDPAPALGSFDPAGQNTGVLRTGWSALTDDLKTGRTPLVVTVAGRLNTGNSLTLQYANRLPDGRIQIIDQASLDDGRTDEAPWREIRITLTARAAQADEVRLVAQDRSLGPDGWLAVAPLRGPQLRPLAAGLGDTPMFLEYPVVLANACLNQFDVRDGIAQMPTYRLTADDSRMRDDGANWSGPPAAGPLGWITLVADQQELPTYLAGQPGRDWGQVQRLTPYDSTAVTPTIDRGQRRQWGTYTPGPMGDPPPGIASPER